MATRSKVFICYHESSENYVRELRDNLAVYQRETEGRLDTWDPSRLKAGDLWQDEIAAAIERTRIAVLFITPSFNSSRFISEVQLPALLEAAEKDGARIMPVYAEPCAIPRELRRFRFVNPPRKRARGAANELGRPGRQRLWLELAEAIAEEMETSALEQEAMVAVVEEEEQRQAEGILADIERHHDLQFRLETWSRHGAEPERAAWRERIGESSSGILGLLVFVGVQGLGPWSDTKLRRLLRSLYRAGKPMAFVLLAERLEDLTLPTFLQPSQILELAATADREEFARKIALCLLEPGYLERRDEAELEVPEKKAPKEPDLKQPFEPAETPKETEIEVREALGEILEELGRSENLTFFVGAGVYPVGSKTSSKTRERRSAKGTGAGLTADLHPLRLSAITYRLLERLGLDYQELLPPVDVVSDYYDIGTQNDNELDETLSILCREAGEEKEPTSIHELIAAVVKKLVETQKNRDPLLVERQPVILIVTTNFDLMMERALIEAEVAFTRIVQHRGGDKIDVNEYRKVTKVDNDENSVRIQTSGIPYERQGTDEGEEQDQDRIVDKRHVEEIYDAIEQLGIPKLEPVRKGEGLSDLQSFDLEGFTSPYLYKHHGSADIEGSCAVTTEQYFEFIRHVLKRGIIPERIREVLSSGPILFFGYSMLDPDFRVTMHTLLRGNPDPQHRYSIQPAPRDDSADNSERVEARLWERVRKRAAKDHSIKILEAEGGAFLKKFVDKI